ncbi:MAG: hypothetical protein WAN35_14320 [Terracidiphilus sp.]
MIARFHIFLPFDLFITDEEQIGIQGEVSDPAIPNIRIVIPTAWGYAERPDPTGTIHEVTSAWLFRVKDPQFSNNCLYDNCRVARVNVLVFELMAEDFDRTNDHLLKDGPLIKPVYEAANDFLARLRVYARLPQIRALVPAHDPWHVEFLTNDRQLLPEEDGKLRMVRNSSVELGVFAFKADTIKIVSEKWTAHEPYIWDQLLLDAHSLWPNVGSSIVIAFAAMETFIAWALEALQSTNHSFPDDGWKWIMNRGNFMKEPSVAEQYDALLSILGAKSLKSDEGLWTTFKELKDARNSLAHEGVAKLHNGTPVDAAKARMLIDGAARIIEWVEALLPESSRRHNKGFATPVARRFVTEEQAVLYRLTTDSQD